MTGSVSVFKFYAILSKPHKLLLGLGFFSAIATGLLFPSIALIMGEVVGTFDPTSHDDIAQLMKELLFKILLIAGVLWLNGYLYYAIFQ